jgi:cyclic pyranopterin phosphate synthase
MTPACTASPSACDTLRPERFKRLTRRDSHGKVLQGIQAAEQVGFTGLKLDTVVIRGTNEDELIDLIEYGKRVEAEVRFIEYMDVGGATQWSMDKVVSRADILAHLEHHYGTISPIREHSSAPAERFRLPDGTVFGIIASTTTPFCRSCDRSRLTADGMWYLCFMRRKVSTCERHYAGARATTSAPDRIDVAAEA